MHPLLLRRLPLSAKAPLASLLNRSWREGRVPSAWRTATIVPILKRGKPAADIKSNRPVSLLSTIGKTLEAMVQRRMQAWAERNHLIPDCQSGFRPDRSTSDALNQLLQRAFDRLQHKPMRRTVLVAVDFKGAFDTVWRRGLLRKLADFNIPPRWLQWLRSFLADRRACVRWNEDLSRTRVISQGVPQGSPLSPLLFLLFVSSIPAAIQDANPEILPVQYADDLTLEGANIDPHRAGASVQESLRGLERWCVENHMRLAPEKTEALLISTHPRENNGKLQLNLSLLNRPVRIKPTIRILGVTIDSTLTMSSQVREAAAKIRQRCGALSAVGARSWGADTTTLRDLYMGYVRPAGTYAIGAWWPYAAPSVKARAEAANNTGARTIVGAPAGSKASATRQEAGLPSLEALARLDAGLQLLHYRRFPAHHPLQDLAQPPAIATRQKARGGGTRGNWRESALASLAEAGLQNIRPQPLMPPEDHPPPWEGLGADVHFHATQGTSRDDLPEVRRQAATRMMEEVRRVHGPPNIEVWTDGAADEGITNGGAGAVIVWHDDRANSTPAPPPRRQDLQLHRRRSRGPCCRPPGSPQHHPRTPRPPQHLGGLRFPGTPRPPAEP